MDNLDLVHYIEQARKSGMGDNKIREGLLQAGWPVSSVEEVMMFKENPKSEVLNPKQGLKIQNSKTSIRNAIFAILVLGTSVTGYFGGAYYMANYQSFPLWPFEASIPVSTFTSRPSPIATPDPTADWQTYRNDEYWFEFKYPNAWNISSVSQKNSIYALGLDSTVQSHDDTDLPYDIEISVYSNISDLDYQKLGVKNLNDFLNKYSDRPDPKFINVKSITINQELGYQADSGPNSFAGGTYYYFFNGTYIYEMFDFGDLPEFDQILSTFQFIK